MILKEMFEAQAELDKHINANHTNVEDKLGKKVVATIVEMGEMANEVRFFKYWSNKGANEKSMILEETVDVLHFLLMLGNDIGVDSIKEHNYKMEVSYKSVSVDFLDICENVILLRKTLSSGFIPLSIEVYVETIEKYLGFLYKLGFGIKDIENAYYKKNAKNHERQDTGY